MNAPTSLASGYPGPFATGTQFGQQVYVRAVALSDLPDKPLAAADLTSYLLPLPATPINWTTEGGVSVFSGTSILFGHVDFPIPNVSSMQPMKAIALIGGEAQTVVPWLVLLTSPIDIDLSKQTLRVSFQAISFLTIPG